MANAKPLINADSQPLSDQRIEIPSGSLSLAAKLTVLSPCAPMLILAHGFAGDMDENGLFVEARDFFAGMGFSVLRFDFRGCGASDGDFRKVGLKDLACDLSSVVKYVRSQADLRPTAIGMVCFSLAAGVAILANTSRIGAYAFWSPAVYTDRDMVPRYRSREVLEQVARRGWFMKAGQRVAGAFIEELASRQIEDAIAHFRHPVFLVHGSDDQRIPSASSQKLVRHLAPTSRLILIPGADHSFRSNSQNREWVFTATATWLNKRLGKSKSTSEQTQMFSAIERGCEH